LKGIRLLREENASYTIYILTHKIEEPLISHPHRLVDSDR